MKQFLVVGALVGLAACDADVNVKHDGGKDKGKVEISGDGEGQVDFNLPFAKGTIKLPSGMMDSAKFDIDGVKMYPGSKIDGFFVDAGKGESATVNIAFNAPASPDAVRGYFLQQFKEKGAEAQASGDGITGRSKDGDAFQMSFAPEGEGTKGTIKIVAKGDQKGK